MYRFFAFMIIFATVTTHVAAQHKASGSSTNAAPFYPGTPAEEHISADALAKIFPYVHDQEVNLHSLLLIRDKKIVLDAYFYPYRNGLRHDMASCTKSVTGLLIGIAMDHGFIRDENQLVRTYFPEIKTYSKNFQTLTIKDLLTMTSGLECGFDNEDKLFARLFQSNNWPAFIFNIPSITEPGKQFSYCSCNFQLLAEILYRATKLTPGQFADKYLFKPLGIAGYYWDKNEQGVNHGWGDLNLKPIDLAKIGQLLMNQGKWNNKQVISAGYIKKATAIQVPFSDNKGYGYGFWIDNDHAFNAVGRGGQRLYVDRLHKVIIVATGGGYDWDEKGGLSDLLSASFKLKDNDVKQALDTLIARTQLAAKQVHITAPNFVDQPEQSFFNKEIRFSQNRLGIKNARIVVGKDTTFNLTWNDGRIVVYPLGLGSQYHFYNDPTSGHVFAVRGYWKANADFQIDFNTLTKINRFLMDFKLAQHQPEVYITEDTKSVNEKIPVEIVGGESR
ncbi:CubicO group peptidase (beta-lactamase class C family) [Chitinophaga dinghuensis]|uniref:CubicO group peptidase (Beta-lactamase class C family) n=1 Tax=Chitinophaga dinghuensis TaxID=1539050 RepID=A0A327VQK2_9BACT|nr:serine hydrolase [Chitinophaga dinghuensis]RAJ77333.1 CubicO group peptidase (beta-lactamase class C family) [Chitinophaga dinghuensis]